MTGVDSLKTPLADRLRSARGVIIIAYPQTDELSGSPSASVLDR